MDRGHEFTIELPGDGTWAVKLLEGVDVQRSDAGVIGRWPAFDLEAEGDGEDAVHQALLGDLVKKIGQPGTPEHAPFAAYVRANGTLLSKEETATRELARVRRVTLRWHVTDEEQYLVPLFRDAEIEHTDDAVTVRAFGVEGVGAELNSAIRSLNTAIDAACGDVEEPGPRFAEITAWVREHGEPVPPDVLAKEAADKKAYLVARDKLTAITPDDIVAESSTGVPLLVDFWADWCAPCRMVTPVLVGLAEQWAGRIVVRKVDVDQFEGVWERFGFRGIPAMLLFKDGREIHRVLGFGGKAALVSELEPHLA